MSDDRPPELVEIADAREKREGNLQDEIKLLKDYIKIVHTHESEAWEEVAFNFKTIEVRLSRLERFCHELSSRIS